MRWMQTLIFIVIVFGWLIRCHHFNFELGNSVTEIFRPTGANASDGMWNCRTKSEPLAQFNGPVRCLLQTG